MTPLRVGDLIQITYNTYKASYKVLICRQSRLPIDTFYVIQRLGPSSHKIFDKIQSRLLNEQHDWILREEPFPSVEVFNVTTGWRSKPNGLSKGLQQAIENASLKKDIKSCHHCYSKSTGKSWGIEPGTFNTPCSQCLGSCKRKDLS